MPASGSGTALATGDVPRIGADAREVSAGAWTSGELPRFVIITFRDANPYFDTSYSVNSPNVGPYGDALTEELIPYLEDNFRIVDERHTPEFEAAIGCPGLALMRAPL